MCKKTTMSKKRYPINITNVFLLNCLILNGSITSKNGRITTKTFVLTGGTVNVANAMAADTNGFFNKSRG